MALRSRIKGKAKQHFFMDAHMSEVLDPVPDEVVSCGAATKVVMTLGPACHQVDTLVAMLEAGVAAARVDLTWGTQDYHRRSLENLRAAMRRTRRLCAVWLDTTGREVIVRRAAPVDADGWPAQKNRPLAFTAGAEVVVTTDPDAEASPSLLPVNIPTFTTLVQPGSVLQLGRYLATGAEGSSVGLEVLSAGGAEARCRVLNSAALDGLMTICVSHEKFALETLAADLNREIPLLTAHDVACITAFCADYEVDFVSLSYCNSPEDVAEARELLERVGAGHTKVVAKVERKAAVHNFEAIVQAADGVLLSRGNLGLDFEAEEMFLLQKRCVSRCNQLGKPVIVTRFVDTMVNTPRPTRAEATDVANAVLDGVDGVMLGAETLRGAYPVETARTVVRLCAAAEAYFDYQKHHEDLLGESFTQEVSMLEAHPSEAELLAASRSTAELRRGLSFGNLAAAGAGGGGASAPPTPPTAMSAASAAAAGGGSPTRLGGDGARVSSFGTLPAAAGGGSTDHLSRVKAGSAAAYSSKLESIASSAVRTAEKIHAGLIVVLAQTGRTTSLVSKYRPPMPILAVVVPTLRSDRLGWRLDGKYLARQCLVMRGVHPVLAAPQGEGTDDLLGEAIAAAAARGLVRPSAHVVCIMSHRGGLVVKVVQANASGDGVMKQATPTSLSVLVGGAGSGRSFAAHADGAGGGEGGGSDDEADGIGGAGTAVARLNSLIGAGACAFGGRPRPAGAPAAVAAQHPAGMPNGGAAPLK